MEDQQKPKKLDLVEPEPDKIEEIIELFTRAAAEHKTTKEREYWQGRKDGIRAALAILEPGRDGEEWTQLNESSHGFKLEEKEALLKFIEDARYNVGAALWEYETKKSIDIQTIVNLLQWLASYDLKVQKEELLPAENAISPSWEKLTRRK
jgi:hypothetical protein